MVSLSDAVAFETDAVNVVRSVYIAGVAAGLMLNSVTFLKETIVNYGSRALPDHGADNQRPGSHTIKSSVPASDKGTDKTSSNVVVRLITDGVPHAWFVHFYVLSVTLSLFWGWSLATRGPAFLFVSRFVDMSRGVPSMTISQVRIVWLLMLLQGIRRLLESVAFMKASASRMPWPIYGIGLVYYMNMSVAVWIEGTKAVLNESVFEHILPLPSLRTTIGLIVFTLASGFQHDCHAYLASLQKYTLPVHPAFHRIVCPHYTAEVVLYIALAFTAAPQGQFFNATLLMNVIFVVVNLGLVADETKRWSERKFGKDKVRKRARMIPLIW